MPVNAPNEQLDLTAPDFDLLSVDNNRYKFLTWIENQKLICWNPIYTNAAGTLNFLFY